MALKRKRSTGAFASPMSDASDASHSSSAQSIPFFYQQSKPVEPLYSKPTWSFPTYSEDTISHLGSRTRKRHRDDRPDEASIYGALPSGWLGEMVNMSALADVCRGAASTISKLYNAQRENPRASPIPSQPPAPAPAVFTPAPFSQRSTLHAFWHINNPPAASAPMHIDCGSSTTSLEGRCEDCDGPLRSEDAMDVDELQHGTACHACNKHVCDTCAVVGQGRSCLSCANSSGLRPGSTGSLYFNMN